jgi:two-component system cell cycle sensor histidine kinase/response regulator CckA
MSVAPDLWLVEIDPGQISQVIQNLVLNAVQAMPGGGRLHVSLENRPGVPPGATDGLAGPHVAVTVRDEGIGILPEHLPHIFDPYFTTKQEGSGLGLTTCYSIVTQHEGSLSVTSQVGVGSTFTVCLPRAPEDARLATSPTGLAGAPRGDARILIMDDERSVREVAIASLGDLGYRIEGVSRGEDAIAAYEQALATDHPFDLVILDLTVRGGMGGRETIERLRQIDPRVRAIVCSGYSADLVMRHHREHGFAACVAKPFDVQKLAHIVHEVLSSSDA